MTIKSHNVFLLKELYKVSSMGTAAINRVIPHVEDRGLRLALKSQRDCYNDNCRDLKEKLSKENAEPRKVNPMERMMSDIGIMYNTAIDNSSGKIAELMMNGTNMGIIAVQRALNEAKGADPELRSQAETLLRKEQVYLNRLKKYL